MVESFEAAITEAPRGGAYVSVPADVTAALGGGRRIPVRAEFEGVPYQGSIVSMGDGGMILGIQKAIRLQLGKAIGDTVRVAVERDDSERTVAIPADLAAALDAAGLTDVFTSLSYSHRREYVAWIEEAKRPETRSRRISETVDSVSP